METKIIYESNMTIIKNYIIVLCFILGIQALYAEYPDIDSNGRVNFRHIFLKLDPKQVEQVSRAWAFELNEEQIKRIKKINRKVNIKIMDIITYPYYDCTDDLFCYCVWNKPDSVALPIDIIKGYYEELSYFYDEAEPSDYNYFKNRKDFSEVINRLSSLRIFIDLEGKTYIKYREVTDEEIFKLIDSLSIYNKIPENKLNPKDISISTAPILNDTIGNMIKSKINKFRDYAKNKDVYCWDKISEDIFK